MAFQNDVVRLVVFIALLLICSATAAVGVEESIAVMASPAQAIDRTELSSGSACLSTFTTPAETQPDFDLFVPAPVPMTGCTAEYTCPNGQEISCVGGSTCSVHHGYVVCDGSPTYCNCHAFGCDLECFCACFLQPGCVIQCCSL